MDLICLGGRKFVPIKNLDITFASQGTSQIKGDVYGYIRGLPLFGHVTIVCDYPHNTTPEKYFYSNSFLLGCGYSEADDAVMTEIRLAVPNKRKKHNHA